MSVNHDDVLKAFMKEMQEKEKQWDQFPSGNLCEMLRPIERRSFDFEYHNVQVWQGGKCVAEASGKFRLTALVHGNILHVQMPDPRLSEIMVPEFRFGQISENGDRIMWSKDIFGESEEIYQNDPTIMSLFYKGGHIARIYLRFYVPDIMIELNGTSNITCTANNSTKTRDTNKYADILAYFVRHPFGTEMPVLTLLSTLPPRDRCMILEAIRKEEPMNIEVYDKLSMAYIKNGQDHEARNVLQEGIESGALNDFTGEQLYEKITLIAANMYAAPQKSCQSYTETASILMSRFAQHSQGQFREFYTLLLKLCSSG